MKMKVVWILSIFIFISSCSHTSKTQKSHDLSEAGRSLSSLEIQRIENVSSFISELKEQKRERFLSVLDVYQWQGGEFVGVGYREIQWGQGEGPLSFKLDSQDTVLQVQTLEDFLLVRTFFGLLLKVNKLGVEIVQAGFPVASFEYVDGILHLYNKNGRGRFCDQEELKRSPDERDPSCQFVAAKLVLD